MRCGSLVRGRNWTRFHTPPVRMSDLASLLLFIIIFIQATKKLLSQASRR